MFNAPVLDLYVTGACNLACPYCFGELDFRPGMKRETFRQALSFAQIIGASTIELCGGEPLLYRDLDWAVALAKVEGFGLILRTNALLALDRSAFIANHFQAVGISLDGDAEANHRMRPSKGRRDSPETKFEVPLNAVVALKELNPELRVLLATVATAENIPGILRLADILVERRLPIDLWKIHQFVSNNFRSLENKDRFTIGHDDFAALETDLARRVGGRIPISCRRAEVVDGSCLIVTQNGEVRVGAASFGNLASVPFPEILRRLDAHEAEDSIRRNKTATYATSLT